eukprot:m51a1_g1530 hypothetical protein (599) ;mRNA; r:510516-512398
MSAEPLAREVALLRADNAALRAELRDLRALVEALARALPPGCVPAHPPQPRGLLAALPAQLLASHVLARLDHADIARFSLTCRSARDVCRDAGLWRKLRVGDADSLCLLVARCPHALHATHLEVGDAVFAGAGSHVSGDVMASIADAMPVLESLVFPEGCAFELGALDELARLRRLSELTAPDLRVVDAPSASEAAADTFAALEELCERRAEEVRVLRVSGGGSETSYGAASACVQGLASYLLGAGPSGSPRCLPRLEELVAGDIDSFEVLLFAGSEAAPTLPALRSLALNMDGEPDEDPSDGFGLALARACPALRELRAGCAAAAQALAHCRGLSALHVDVGASAAPLDDAAREDLSRVESLVVACHDPRVHASASPAVARLVARCAGLRKLVVAEAPFPRWRGSAGAQWVRLGAQLEAFEFVGDCGPLAAVMRATVDDLVLADIDDVDDESELLQRSALRSVDVCVTASAGSHRELADALESLQAVCGATLRSLSVSFASRDVGTVPTPLLASVLDGFAELAELTLHELQDLCGVLGGDGELLGRVAALEQVSLRGPVKTGDVRMLEEACARVGLRLETEARLEDEEAVLTCVCKN